jgi:cytochrome c oxidase cbb3-type subunit 4
VSYESLRHFADSYGLVIMTVIWLSFIGWAFRPGARQRSRDAANSIFEDRDHG